MSAITSFVDGLISATKNAEEQLIFPAIATAAQNYAANPSAINGVAVLNELLSEALEDQNKVAQTDLQYIATQAATLANSVVPSPPNTTAPASKK